MVRRKCEGGCQERIRQGANKIKLNLYVPLKMSLGSPLFYTTNAHKKDCIMKRGKVPRGCSGNVCVHVSAPDS